ncbi:MAG: anhydro-N-acetylmuramic acid kinase [Chloroflexi bacterium]|nr:anhydro-N-acetylmuramic acid kinase [Chloroflexota bacterium]
MIIVGLMSGTSADAIDAAVVKMHSEGDTLVLRLLEYYEEPYAPETHARLRAILPPVSGSTSEVCELNVLIGEAFASAALGAAKRAGIAIADIDLIASHGQTIYHQVTPGHVRSTLQIGAPAVIAERTGRTVIADFRTRDIAAGGQGAPLAPYLDTLLCAHPTSHRVLLNIGGIGNLTYIPAGAPHEALAFDTGPGNVLIDEAVRLLSGDRLAFDAAGAWAASGSVDETMLTHWLAEPFFMLPLPKSTGRELFSREDAARRTAALRARGCGDADVLATLTALTARSIAGAIRHLLPAMPDEILVSGGGAHNVTLLRMLAESLTSTTIRRFDDMGLPGDAKEAVLFAVLGYATLHGWKASLPHCTGAARQVVPGSITPGDNYATLMQRVLAANHPPALRARPER